VGPAGSKLVLNAGPASLQEKTLNAGPASLQEKTLNAGQAKD